MEVCHRHCEPWRVTLVDTGEQHADRRAPAARREYLDDGTFCFTYGDGLSNVDIGAVDPLPPRAAAPGDA